MRTFFQLNTGPFTVYYLGYPQDGDDTVTEAEVKVMQSSRGLLEL